MNAIKTTLLVLLFTTSSLLASDKFAGHWEGAIEIPGQTLEFDVDLMQKGDAWQGDISIPVQNAKDLNLVNISVDGMSIKFTIEGIPGDPTFDGKLEDDEIKGTFTQGGGSFPFKMDQGPTQAEKAKAALAGFDAVVEQALADFNEPGIAIGVVIDNEIVLAKGYGYRDLERKRPVTADTLFAIGSTSKAFTAAVLGTLVSEGKMDWDTPVIEYMPDFRLHDLHATHNLTVRDLLSHQSGLPRHDFLWYNSPLTREELFSRLGELEPTADLRQRFQYQNLMFMTAGLLAERVTGKTWETLVKERFFKPLNMKRSNFSVLDSQKDKDYAKPYREDDKEIELIPFRNIDQVGPAGSINSSVNDMLNWVKLNLNEGKVNGEQVLDSAVVREMHTPQITMRAYPSDKNRLMPAYGLAWGSSSYYGHYRVSHGGAIDGFRAEVTLMPLEKIGVVILSNKNGATLTALMVTEVFNRILDTGNKNLIAEALERRKQGMEQAEEAESKKGETRKTGTSPTHSLEQYVGSYEHPGYGIIEVSFEDEQLVVMYNNIKSNLEHWHYNVFNATGYGEDTTLEDTKFQFVNDVDGNVAGLEVVMELLLPAMRFDKLPDQRMTDPEYLAQFTGEYSLPPQSMKFYLKGNQLTLFIVGQREFNLIPKQDDTFELEGLSGFSVQFVKEGDMVTTAKFIQPNGIFDAKRKTEEKE